MSIGNLVIVGTSGHGKVIADIARLNGYEEIVFLDDDTSIHTCAGYPVIGKTDDYGKVQPDNFRNAKATEVVIAIGNSTIRETIQRRFEQQGFPVRAVQGDADVPAAFEECEGRGQGCGYRQCACAGGKGADQRCFGRGWKNPFT